MVVQRRASPLRSSASSVLRWRPVRSTRFRRRKRRSRPRRRLRRTPTPPGRTPSRPERRARPRRRLRETLTPRGRPRSRRRRPARLRKPRRRSSFPRSSRACRAASRTNGKPTPSSARLLRHPSTPLERTPAAQSRKQRTRGLLALPRPRSPPAKHPPFRAPLSCRRRGRRASSRDHPRVTRGDARSTRRSRCARPWWPSSSVGCSRTRSRRPGGSRPPSRGCSGRRLAERTWGGPFSRLRSEPTGVAVGIRRRAHSFGRSRARSPGGGTRGGPSSRCAAAGPTPIVRSP